MPGLTAAPNGSARRRAAAHGLTPATCRRHPFATPTGSRGPFGGRTPDVFAIASDHAAADPVGAMEPGVLLAYELPLAYRHVLDALADLERAGDRNSAIRLRRKALRLYATSWDPGTLRRMREIAGAAAAALTAARSGDGRTRAERAEWDGAQGPAEPAPG